MSADRSEAASHFHKKDDADRAENDRPDELKAKRRSCLGGRRDRADLEKAADAGNNAERYLEKLAHRLSVFRTNLLLVSRQPIAGVIVVLLCPGLCPVQPTPAWV